MVAPRRAAPLKFTVQEEFPGVVMVEGVQITDVIVGDKGGFRVRLADFEEVPSVAVTVAV
jgi:hypothetical protein